MDGLESQGQSQSTSKAANPFWHNRITTILSTSYADSEFREALSLLDRRGIKNNPKDRRQLRLNVQRDVIQSNGKIVTEFGQVANVSQLWSSSCSAIDINQYGSNCNRYRPHWTS